MWFDFDVGNRANMRDVKRIIPCVIVGVEVDQSLEEYIYKESIGGEGWVWINWDYGKDDNQLNSDILK